MEDKKRPVAMITGGTRGIGSGIAEMFAMEGYSLVLGFRENADAAEQFKEHLLQTYGNANCSLHEDKNFIDEVIINVIN